MSHDLVVSGGLVVYPEHMRRNLESARGLFFSEAVMLALVEKGLGRQQAYELVQRNAMNAFSGGGAFQDLLTRDADVGKYLSAAEVARCFDLDHALRWAKTLVERASAAE